ncbi:hypothetical protein CAter10_0676 [Collimonas arenae]|uniref:hypothetical protein n=1 Tax=Collimonas arenae TaxID=279058 RepID=UPI00078B6AA6|nr:hypothetical protein [Collimonas arenae]AMO98557.1 hypothetical protein CAter10_0676 [Collimonas arenae]
MRIFYHCAWGGHIVPAGCRKTALIVSFRAEKNLPTLPHFRKHHYKPVLNIHKKSAENRAF